MTRRDMVKAAIAHEETPRAPYCIGFTGDGEERLREHVGFTSAMEYVDNDVIEISPPWWGWYDLGPEWKESLEPPKTPPTVRGSGSYPEFFDTLKWLRDHSDKYILVQIYGSHFERAYFTRGIENFLADMAGDPEFAQGLLTHIVDRNMVMLENFLVAPEIDGVLLGSDWGSQVDLLMRPETWEEMIRPGEAREYDLVHSFGKDVWVHSCGCVERIIPSLIEIGLDVLNPVQPECMDIQKLKDDYGDRLAFWGGISTQQTLPYGTPEEVKAEVRRVRDIMAKGGGYILSPAQQIQGDVPPENVVALLEVAREEG